MRKIWLFARTPTSTRRLSSRASASEVPNGFSMIRTHRRALPTRARPAVAERARRSPGRTRAPSRGRTRATSARPPPRRARRASSRRRRVARRVVEREPDVAQVLEQAVEHALVGMACGENGGSTRPRSRGTRRGSSSARDADQVEALGQGALVREVVDRRQQLATREVAGRAEDDEVGRRVPADARAPARAGSVRRRRASRRPARLDRVPAELVAQRREHARA